MNSNINKAFIFSYLSGDTSALQKQMVNEWVKETTNEELFYKWLVEYEKQKPQYQTDVSKGIELFHHYVNKFEANAGFNHSKHPEQEVHSIHYFKKRWMLAASVMLGLIIMSWLFKDFITYQTYTTGFGETKSITLSDHTNVTLNSNSVLSVPRFGFGFKTRRVLLKGEANFLVTHKPDNQKFVVRTNQGLEVIVFGTEFIVYAREKESKVILNKGKVVLRYQEGRIQKQLTMKPGDLITFDKINHLKKEITTQPEKYAAWKDHRFIFEDTTLEEFATIMQENYGIRIVFKDSTLAKQTLIGSFRADSADELLQTVSEVFNVNINRTGNTVVMTDN